MLALLLAPPAANAQSAADLPPLGIAHIAGPGETSAARYDLAQALGAGWTRWPLYWDRVQTDPQAGAESWAWDAYDALVAADGAGGLRINAVLLGIPPFFADPDTQIAGLNAPVFANGSDVPTPDTAINPENRWAVFVHAAVARYRPGGTLSTLLGLPPQAGIRTWEIWNEPDLPQFWRGSIADYARLLKVAYLAARQADFAAQIVFGGLLYPQTEVNWLARVLLEYRADPLAARFGYYFDVAAVHSYGDPWRSGWLVQVARDSLAAYGLERPIWLTETGAPVWDDYPGPTGDPSRVGFVSQGQQAAFLAQSAVYAWARGASVVFYHQLFDDCGNQPAGTDFAPGAICGGEACAGEAFGLARNPADAVCFRQHPQPGTLRPAAEVFRLLAVLFGREPFVPGERTFPGDAVRVFTFRFPASGQRLTVAWNTTFTPQTLQVDAAGDDAQVFRLDAPLARSARLLPAAGTYTLALPPAQPDNIPNPPRPQPAAIGGAVVFLIEQVGGTTAPITLFDGASLAESLRPAPTTPPPTLAPTVTPLPPTPTAPPAEVTALPLADTTAPTATVAPLPEVSPPQFTVVWGGTDDTGIAGYVIWVQIDEGDWSAWLTVSDPTQTSAAFIGTPGTTAAFAAWAVDRAGNWSPNVRLSPQAITRIGGG